MPDLYAIDIVRRPRISTEATKVLANGSLGEDESVLILPIIHWISL